MQFDKLMYLMTHVVMPFTFFITYFLWGHFYLSKPVWGNINETLSITAIYYMLASFLWIAYMNSIRKATQEINDKKNQSKN